MEIGSSVASRTGETTCRGCVHSPAVCPCQPVVQPKTFRSASTSTATDALQHVHSTRRVLANPGRVAQSSGEMMSERHVQLMHDSGPKRRSCNVGCGFVRFCHKHIFANPAAVPSVSECAAKVPPHVMSSQNHCDLFRSHFNPCYSDDSPTEDDDDCNINLDAVSLCDSLCRAHTRKARALPAVSEMSESCFEGLQSSSHKQVIDAPRLFRPLSWTDPVDCLVDSGCTCSRRSTRPSVKNENWNAFRAPPSNPPCEIVSGEQPAEMPFYWELELPGASNTGRRVPEISQRLASPVRMGTLTFHTGKVPESSHAHTAAKNLLPNKQLCQNVGYTEHGVKVPGIDCLPAKCLVCRDCQHTSSACGTNRRIHPVLGDAASAPEVHIPPACRCVKQRRCPTPQRMLSPCGEDDDSLKVSC